MLRLLVNVHTFVAARVAEPRERGQATVEYVLIMLGAAAVALLVLAWATSTGRIGALLDRILDSVSGQVV